MTNQDPAAAQAGFDEAFRASVLEGLTGAVKTADPKHFYDAEGSRLFDRICTLPEYYPTRTETAILTRHASEMARAIETVMQRRGGPDGARDMALLELGAGSSVKVRRLLGAMPELRCYIPLDISADHLAASAALLEADHPGLEVRPVEGDFTGALNLPADLEDCPKALFFPGSTIGNFDPDAARDLLARMRALKGAGAFLIGIDLVKDADVLVRAYDDAQGVTAAFNRNLLKRFNAELGANFDLSSFDHESRWNAAESRVEMHLVSRKRQSVAIAGQRIEFEAGESIHTENSYKYSVEGFERLAKEAGWHPERHWSDPEDLFAVHLLA
ncbi:L-histidine N(alpha)-methyltransferase [Profundibacterium mesophilum]|uniref:Histidine-specific methyltransferase SAM-dependent domain-containing protein n=1 Tax=Profundibacterium mesophilum KAUST100406-0324 TaxID=1037889 RepID=A0A921TDC4_9RHOB|nr:L-histidine N(alpha)-methyltransferase [Profundibacterium mesophilum]KAF0676017.1 hypothetical protein PMES_01581 [Profundibacterium mesophilum KAUST100406-0324]